MNIILSKIWIYEIQNFDEIEFSNFLNHTIYRIVTALEVSQNKRLTK